MIHDCSQNNELRCAHTSNRKVSQGLVISLSRPVKRLVITAKADVHRLSLQ